MQCTVTPLASLIVSTILFVFIRPTLQTYLCRRIPNLNSQQLRICEQSPEIIAVIRSGVQLALSECERLFRFQPRAHPAWNCSAWIANSTNRLSVDISHHQVSGTKEAGFAYALFSAGVTFALSEACTRGNFSYCPCVRQSTISQISSEEWTPEEDWKWTGCNHNVEYGMEVARNFLDSKEHQKVSLYSLLNLHNNLMGRKLVKEEMISKCQCHGYSGSCTVKTCWRSLNLFGQVTKSLYGRYKRPKKVTFDWLLQSYRSKLTNRKHQWSMSGARKVFTSRLEWLTKLQQQLLTVTELEFNQPNLDRMVSDKQTRMARRRDLIYWKPSYTYCDYAASHLPPTNRKPSSSTSLRVTRSAHTSALSCVLYPNSTSVTHIPFSSSTPTLQPQPEACSSICCDRGYRLKQVVHSERCECKFQFCCKLDCSAHCQTSTIQFECL